MGILGTHRFLLARVLAASSLSFGMAGFLSAATITYNPAPTTQAGWSPCDAFPGYGCLTTAYFNATTLDGLHQEGEIDTLFTNAWSSTNALNNTGGVTLGISTDARNNGVDGNFNVTVATANQFGPVTLGGATITVTPDATLLASLNANLGGGTIVWAQGLYIDFVVPAGTIVQPYYAMDTTTLSGLGCGGVTGNFCPPSYPFQYVDDHFYDQPRDYYMPPGTTQAFFNADAYIGILNAAGTNLTVYDGLSYGFQNYVSPEPGSWVLLGTGVLAVFVLRRKRATA